MKLRRVIIPGVVVAVLGVSTGVVALLGRPDPWIDTLRGVQDARGRVDYHGVLVLTTFHKESFDTKILVNHRSDQRVQLRLEGWRRGEGEWKEPRAPAQERKEMRLPGRRRIFRPVLNSELTVRNYDIDERPPESVAGREARVLDVIPKRPGRPTYRLWIDRALGSALGMEVRNATGTLISRWKFQTFEEGALEWPGRPKRGRAERLTMEKLLAERPLPLWVPQELPSGYAFRGARIRTRDDRVIALMAYTDGMNVISVIQRSRPSDGLKLKKLSSPAGKPVVHRWRGAGTNILKVRLGETYVTMVGSESPESLTAMVQSMVEHR